MDYSSAEFKEQYEAAWNPPTQAKYPGNANTIQGRWEAYKKMERPAPEEVLWMRVDGTEGLKTALYGRSTSLSMLSQLLRLVSGQGYNVDPPVYRKNLVKIVDRLLYNLSGTIVHDESGIIKEMVKADDFFGNDCSFF